METSLKDKITQLENEVKVIGKICDVLKYSNFTGHMAQDVAIGQMYLQGLHKHMQTEVAKLEAEFKAAVSPSNSVSVVSETPSIEVTK